MASVRRIVSLRDSDFEGVKKIRYLGLQIYCSLDLKEHIKAVFTSL